MSDSSLTRSLTRGKFSTNEQDVQVRDVVARIERLKTFLKPFEPSFDSAEQVVTMLEILAGCDVALQIAPKEIEAEKESQ